MCTVYNVSEGDEYDYSCSPREAVLAAYAQYVKKNYNTWEYEEKYGHLVTRTKHGWYCEDFWAMDKSPELALNYST